VYFRGKLVRKENVPLLQNGVWVAQTGTTMGADRLGSVTYRGYGGAASYYPYGEEETPTANDTQKFATYTRDSATGLDYAQNRYYASQIGRFTTADPYVASGGPADPGSWNRYAYVQGDPVNANDPTGGMIVIIDCDSLHPCPPGDGPVFSGSGGDDCGGIIMDPRVVPTVFGLRPACAIATPPPVPIKQLPDQECQTLLSADIQTFLASRYPSLAAYAGDMISTGAHYDIDPRLFAAIAVAENGQYQNNPFALGPNGSATFASIAQAIQRLGSVLDTYIYRWRESTVDRLWDGNPWVVDPQKPWITIQYPAYCVATSPGGLAACVQTGNNVSNFMTSMDADPNNLSYPCDN
jgi:RHS repeat-associated protein